MDIKKILHHAFFGFITYMAAGTVMNAYLMSEQFQIPYFPVVGAAMAVFLLASAKIIMFRRTGNLPKESGSGICKRRYFLPVICMFCVLMLAAIGYILVTGTVQVYVDVIPEGMDAMEYYQMRGELSTNMLILLIGILFLWFLFLRLVLAGNDRVYPRVMLTFFRQDIPAYLFYRLAVITLTLIGVIIMGFSAENTQNNYFLFVLDESLVQDMALGSVTNSGFVSGATAASSFFVLSAMAEELIGEAGKTNMREKFLRMFLSVDTIKLLVMTVTCIGISLLSFGQEESLPEKLLGSILMLLWVISLLLFLADTNLLDYLIHLTTMGFVERLIATPDIHGYAGFFAALAVTVVRIVLFALVAMLIAFYQVERKKEEGRAQRTGLLHKICKATLLDALILMMRLGEGGMRALRKSNRGSQEQELADLLVSLARRTDGFILRLLTPVQNKLRKDVAHIE